MTRAAPFFCLIFSLLALGAPARANRPSDLSDLAFAPHPGAQLPLAASLRDEAGGTLALGRFFTGKPVILVLEYLRCRSLCGVTLRGLFAALDTLPLEPGRDYGLLAVGIDPRDAPADAAAAKAKYLAEAGRPVAGGGMHFLTGPATEVQQIADAVGFPYRYDPLLDQYLHPAGFILATGDGRISRYFLGVEIDPAQLEAGLVGAAQGEAVGPLTRLLLLCHFDGGRAGRFTAPVLAALTVANLAGLLILGAVFAARRRRRHG